MTWNWQEPDWPHFSWDAPRLAKAEERFLLETGVFVGTVRHIGPEDREQLTVEFDSVLHGADEGLGRVLHIGRRCELSQTFQLARRPIHLDARQRNIRGDSL